MADAFVRPARGPDAADVARIQALTWRTAYRQTLPAAVLAELESPEGQSSVAGQWRQAIEEPPSNRHRVFVALEGAFVVGFAAATPADDEDGVPAGETAQVTTLLVEPRWGRRGHGSRLLAAVVDHWRLDGIVDAITWIPESDVVSRSFYSSAGWAPDGTARTLDADGTLLREIRLRTLVDPEPEEYP